MQYATDREVETVKADPSSSAGCEHCCEPVAPCRCLGLPRRYDVVYDVRCQVLRRVVVRLVGGPLESPAYEHVAVLPRAKPHVRLRPLRWLGEYMTPFGPVPVQTRSRQAALTLDSLNQHLFPNDPERARRYALNIVAGDYDRMPRRRPMVAPPGESCPVVLPRSCL